jgi:hypothetical protein
MAVSGVSLKSSEIGLSKVTTSSLGYLTFLVKALRSASPNLSASSDVLSDCFSTDRKSVVQFLTVPTAVKMSALTLALGIGDSKDTVDCLPPYPNPW